MSILEYTRVPGSMLSIRTRVQHLIICKKSKQNARTNVGCCRCCTAGGAGLETMPDIVDDLDDLDDCGTVTIFACCTNLPVWYNMP